MVVRPAREALGMQRGIEAVRWLFIGTAVVTLAVNPVFGLLVSRYRRLVFITATYLFFAVSLLGLLRAAGDGAGSDRRGERDGVLRLVQRLQPVRHDGVLGADGGPLLAGAEQAALRRDRGGRHARARSPARGSPRSSRSRSARRRCCWSRRVRSGWRCVAALVVARLQPHGAPSRAATRARPGVDERAVIGGSAWEGFRAVFRSPYLLGISAYVLILAVIATFIYFTRLQMVAALGDDLDMRTAVFARIDLYTQIATLVLQALVAGHLMKRLGVPVTLALLPVTVALGFLGLAHLASLATLVVFQAAFNAVQRAIMRPARETLFTVVSREDKYKSKAFIDTFVYRGGDVVGAQVEGRARAAWRTGLTALVAVAVPLAVVWAALGVWLGRAQRERAAREPHGVPAEACTIAFATASILRKLSSRL